MLHIVSFRFASNLTSHSHEHNWTRRLERFSRGGKRWVCADVVILVCQNEGRNVLHTATDLTPSLVHKSLNAIHHLRAPKECGDAHHDHSILHPSF